MKTLLNICVGLVVATALLSTPLATWFFRSPSGPANLLVARQLIQGMVPASWTVLPGDQEQAEMTQEYFPDGRVQTLTLVGPQIDHLRWTDRQGSVHVEDWSKECLLLWFVPGSFKPRFPNFLDRMASGVSLPTCIYSSRNVCVYGYVTTHGADLDRIRAFGKECTEFSIDGLRPSWINWATDIEHQLVRSGKGIEVP